MAKRKRSAGGKLPVVLVLSAVATVLIVVWASGGYINFGNQGPARTPVPDVRRTQTPTPDRTRTRTPFPTVTLMPLMYTVIGDATARSCPETTCEAVANFAVGDQVLVVDYARGQAVDGDNVWRIVEIDGERVYVHNALVSVRSNVLPSATRRPTHAATRTPGNTAIPVSTAAATQSWQCVGDLYNCGSFANRNELLSYFNACPGDPSKLDQDGDGVPCE